MIDAFVGEGARGNRAAVVLCDALPRDTEMQARAAEIAQPATAFVAREFESGLHPIRWFDAAREIALCGHGALTAGAALLGRSDKQEVGLRTGDGREVTVREAEGENRYELCLPAILTEPCDWPELVAALGEEPGQLRWNPEGYALAVFEDARTVYALAPDFATLAALGNLQVSASAIGAGEADIVSRVFSAGREDAATGSAHAALAPFWCARLKLEKIKAYQASSRGGRIECRLENDQVWLGGECRMVT